MASQHPAFERALSNLVSELTRHGEKSFDPEYTLYLASFISQIAEEEIERQPQNADDIRLAFGEYYSSYARCFGFGKVAQESLRKNARFIISDMRRTNKESRIPDNIDAEEIVRRLVEVIGQREGELAARVEDELKRNRKSSLLSYFATAAIGVATLTMLFPFSIVAEALERFVGLFLGVFGKP